MSTCRHIESNTRVDAIETAHEGISAVTRLLKVPPKERDSTLALDKLHSVWCDSTIRARPLLYAQVLASLGQAHRIDGKYDLAIKFYNQVLRVSVVAEEECPQARLEMLGRGGLILAYLSVGDGETALRECELYIAAAEGLADQEAIGRGLGNVGCSHQVLCEWTQAIAVHRKRRKMAQALGDRAAEGRAMGNIGVCHLMMGKPKQAELHFRERLKIAEAVGDEEGVASAYHNLGALAVEVQQQQRRREMAVQNSNHPERTVMLPSNRRGSEASSQASSLVAIEIEEG